MYSRDSVIFPLYAPPQDKGGSQQWVSHAPTRLVFHPIEKKKKTWPVNIFSAVAGAQHLESLKRMVFRMPESYRSGKIPSSSSSSLFICTGCTKSTTVNQ